MIDRSIEELFSAIENSSEYKKYKEIKELLDQDKEICKMIDKIKVLQKKSVNLEYNNDIRYKEIDKEIEELVNELNSRPIYKEYLRLMNNFNDILSESSFNIEKYINDKI